MHIIWPLSVVGTIAIIVCVSFLRISSTPKRSLQHGNDSDHRDTSFVLESTIAEKNSARKMSSRFEADIWPQLKNKLCPSMRPNIALAKERIFNLARERVGLDPNFLHHAVKEQDNDDVYGNFFEYSTALHEYKADQDDNVMVYVPVWKCANEQLRYAMSKSLGNNFNSDYNRVYSSFFEQIPENTNKKPCFVTAIRDPISHFLSGYNEIEFRYHLNHGLEGEEHYGHLRFTRIRHGLNLRFEHFVAEILAGGNSRELLEMAHLYLMSGVLVGLAEQGANLTAYMPSMHNLTDHWNEFVSSSCPDVVFPEGFASEPLERVAEFHESERDIHGNYAMAKRVWHEGGPTAQTLCILHVMDYACFDKLEIPPLCQNVYSEEGFVVGIMADRV